MKKIFIIFSSIILFGCSTISGLKANMFQDLWNKYVIDENTHIVKNISDKFTTNDNYESFYELDREINELRNFLILGEKINDQGETELVFKDGLMKISGRNNEKIINQMKEIIDIIDENGEGESLTAAIKEVSKNIKKTCLKQKVDIECK
jgi:hypothetical protein